MKNNFRIIFLNECTKFVTLDEKIYCPIEEFEKNRLNLLFRLYDKCNLENKFIPSLETHTWFFNKI